MKFSYRPPFFEKVSWKNGKTLQGLIRFFTLHITVVPFDFFYLRHIVCSGYRSAITEDYTLIIEIRGLTQWDWDAVGLTS